MIAPASCDSKGFHMRTIKIAGVQMDVQLANSTANVASMTARLEQSVAEGAQLTIFPECAVTGYCFESFDEAWQTSESLDEGPSIAAMKQSCKELQTYAIFGYLEREGENIFNSCVCIGPAGVVANYRKVHLPTLGVDNFTTPGDESNSVFEIRIGEQAPNTLRIGMNICYDCSFPEAARVLMLCGADLVALPTNWPPGSGLVADVIPNTRALENNLYFAAVNRIGTERGFDFIGKSKICDPLGRELDFANHCDESILYADIDIEFARRKHLVAVPGKHEVHRVEDRRPETYRALSDPKNG